MHTIIIQIILRCLKSVLFSFHLSISALVADLL